MATSGSTRTNTAFGYVELSWSTSSQSVENNTSTIAYDLKIYRSSNISSSAAKAYSIVINGTTVASGTTSIGGSGTKTIKSGTVTIPHNADGTKTFSYSFAQEISITWSGAWIGTISGSGNGALNAIARATTPILQSSSITMGTAVTITLNRASTAFTHTLVCTFGTQQFNIAFDIGTSYSWTVPLTLANDIPNAVTGLGSITCHTYNGSTLIGSKSVNFTASVPASVVPAITGVSLSEAVSGIATKFSGYVQNKSKLNVQISANGAYNSTITKYETYIQGVAYHGSSFTSNLLTASGAIGVITTVTDSRGRTAQSTTNMVVIPYSTPIVSVFSAYRCDANGNADYEGNRVKVIFNFTISPVNDLNEKYYEIVYRVKGATNWGALASGNIYSLDTSIISGAVINVDNAYDLAINVYDYFSGAHAQLDIPTAFTLVDFRSTGRGISFGEVSSTDNFNVAMDAVFKGSMTINGIDSTAFARRTTSTSADGSGILGTAIGNVGYSADVPHAYIVFIKDTNNSLYLGFGLYLEGSYHTLTKIGGAMTANQNNYGTISPSGTGNFEFSFIFLN